MIDISVLRILLAKGSGDGTLKRINIYMKRDFPYSLEEVCARPQLLCYLGIKEDVAQNIYASKEKALILQEQLYENGIDMCWIGDSEYPQKLGTLETSNIPAVLFYKGNRALLNSKCVGFTGSRQSSDSGIQIADTSARQLSSNGITIVSGYAKGVDITAHRAALESGGNTIFVIVEGMLRNRVKGEIKNDLNEKNHLFVSQFLPNSIWTASNAMKRNNTIIGLADAMILIESGMNGGTFNAGTQSLKNEKPLFVVEYKTGKPSAVGNEFFLQHGGIPIRSDVNGKPILRKVYSALDQGAKKDQYQQLCLDFSNNGRVCD